MAILTAAALSTSTVTEWRPQPGPQEMALRRSEKEIFYGGARGAGKTEVGIAFIGAPCVSENGNYKGLVLRKNSVDLSDWLYRAKRFYGDMVEIGGTVPELRFKTGAIVRTGHLKDMRSLDSYQGQEYQRMLVEELTQIPTEDLYLKLLGSCRSITDPTLRPQIMSNGNPGGRGHTWVKKRFVDVAKNRAFQDKKSGLWRVYIPATVDDNPILIKNDPEYVKFLESLPEPLKSAWRFGNWDLFIGLYFMNFGPHLYGDVQNIQPSELSGRMFGSFDYGFGLTGKSSFGLWYLDQDNVPIRMATWFRVGLTVSEQAQDLVEWIASFPHTGGAFPCEIVYDYAMDTAGSTSLEKGSAPIDFFKAAFKKYGTKWTPANKQRVNGWQIVLDFFGKNARGESKMLYWPEYNDTFEECFNNLMHDPNRVDDVQKCDIDHPGDETRYFLVWVREKIAGALTPAIKPKPSSFASIPSSFGGELGMT